eukprot:Mrub_08063.p1 GENE.Mrub_08063~~Mrub_08063.p1  ORF type:complete len:232 (-),score=61.55 Mrub_08063:170-865(-)
MTKIFFLPKCWYLKFYLSYDKPAVNCSNEEFDLPIEKIHEYFKNLNALYKNQGLDEMAQIWNNRDANDSKDRLYKIIFESIDTDKGGYLDFDEVKAWALKINKNYDEKQIDQILEGMDENNDRTVDLDEFVKFMVLLSTPQESKELRKYYDIIDMGGNGYISRDELLQFYRKLGFQVQMRDINALYDTMQISKEEDLTFQKFYSIFEFNQNSLKDYSTKNTLKSEGNEDDK